jgi:hypothetical protein
MEWVDWFTRLPTAPWPICPAYSRVSPLRDEIALGIQAELTELHLRARVLSFLITCFPLAFAVREVSEGGRLPRIASDRRLPVARRASMVKLSWPQLWAPHDGCAVSVV